MTISEFLMARLAEDEAAAAAASASPVEARYVSGADIGPAVNRLLLHRRFDAARVLGDVAAKRALLKRLEVDVDGCTDDAEWRGASTALDRVQEYLAAPYDTHPDYDPAWRVPTTEENRS